MCLRTRSSAAWGTRPSSCRAGIVLDLVTLGDCYDVALRDLGLLVGALSALAAGRGQDVLERDPATS